MNDRLETLFRLHDEAMAHVRHLEEQRSQFASVLVAVCGGVVAFGLADGKLHTEYYLGVLLIGVGAFGLLLSWKQNEKINFHRRVAIRHRELIAADAVVVSDRLEAMRKEEDRINDRRYCLVSVLPVGLFWSLLYAMILGFGGFVAVHSK
ncbi:MAG TPA: hypothetical protein PLF88_11125 [Opitutaceae bacterium]|nr:hypothetical protein [Opitutaceae bacterium]